MVKSAIRKLVPSERIPALRRAAGPIMRPLEKWRARREFLRDAQRYAKFMTPSDPLVFSGMPIANVETQLTKDYNRVEKALTFKEPRRPFGTHVGDRIEDLMPRVDARTELYAHAASSTTALREWNAGGGVSDEIAPLTEPADRGVNDPEAFFLSRHSVRNFSDRPVADEDLQRAVTLAMSAPSVCNRQSWRVRFLRDDAALKARKFQNGNGGFGDIPVVAVVTTDLYRFCGPGERNQAWIDGGLFAMNLVMALHSIGIDSCMLNMSLTNDRIARARAAIGIPEHEAVIMMVAIGYGEEGHRRARSPRRALDTVIR